MPTKATGAAASKTTGAAAPKTRVKIAPHLKVKEGQVTFDAEGKDNKASIHFSRVVHWPGTARSGVTIGRGYDMGSRIQEEVKGDMTRAGVPLKKAIALSKGAGLKGDKAKAFVKNNKQAIGEITHAQQIRLFNIIYPKYKKRAERNYDRWTGKEKGRVEWDRLDQPIRDILVDFVYQGFTKGANPMRAGMNNNYDELINYINTTPAIKKHEAGRQRAKYLEKHRPVEKAGAKK